MWGAGVADGEGGDAGYAVETGEGGGLVGAGGGEYVGEDVGVGEVRGGVWVWG